jgi:hypothetical protein
MNSNLPFVNSPKKFTSYFVNFKRGGNVVPRFFLRLCCDWEVVVDATTRGGR